MAPSSPSPPPDHQSLHPPPPPSSPHPSPPIPSTSPFPPILCFGLILTLFVCAPQNVQSASPEASTVYTVEWRANAGTDNSGFFQSANLSGGIVSANGAAQNWTTTTAKSSTTSRPTSISSASSTTTGAPPPTMPLGIGIKYGMVLPLNMLCTFLQLYVSIFGRRMRMNGLRWFTIYYNIWNIYQMILVSDIADTSPWRGWLNDGRIVANRESLELFTMSFFPLGVILLLPLLLLSHFCFFCSFRWIPWLPLFLLLSLLPTFLYNGAFFNFNFPLVKGNGTLGTSNGTEPPADLVQTYAFTVISLSIVSLLYLIPMVFVAIFFFLCYRLLNRFNPKSNHPLRASRMLDLILLLPFLLIVLLFHMPCFVVNLSGFFLANIYPWLKTTIIPFLTGLFGGPSTTPAGPVNPLAMPSWMLNVMNAYNNILMYKDDSEMFLPTVEFLASFLFIRMYREQYLGLLSCYACYKEDKDGALGICCCPGRPSQLAIGPAPVEIVGHQPQNPQMWAQPVRK